MHDRTFLIVRPLGSGHDEFHQLGSAWDRSVQGVRQFKPDFVRTGWQSYKDHGFAAGIDNGPGLVIDVIVQVSNAGRYLQRSFAEHRQNTQVFGPVLDEHASQGQLFGNRWIDD